MEFVASVVLMCGYVYDYLVFPIGKVVVHALDEEARAYYDLDGLLTTETLQEDSIQVLFEV